MKLRDLFLEAKPSPKKKTTPTKKPQGKLDFDSMSDKDFDAYMQNKNKAPAPEKKASAPLKQKKSSNKKTSKPKASSMPKFADLAKNASSGKEEPNYADMSDADFDSAIGKIDTTDAEMDNIAKKSGHHFGSDSDIDMGKPPAKPEEPIDVSDEVPPPLPKAKPKAPPLPNKPIPSLSQLAKTAGDESDANDVDLWSKFGKEDPNRDSALKGLPNFDNSSPEENPFGEPPLPDVRTTAQKGVDALKKGGQSAFSKAMSSVGKAGSLVKQKAGSIFNKEPSVPFATAPKDTGADSNWNKQSGEADADMPTLRRLTQQTNTNTSNTLDKVGKKPQPFLAAGQDPKWKVGQVVDWRGQKDFKVISAEKGRYTLQKVENGEIKTYKFIPGGNGLMQTTTPDGSEKNFPGFKSGFKDQSPQAQAHPEDNDEESDEDFLARTSALKYRGK